MIKKVSIIESKLPSESDPSSKGKDYSMIILVFKLYQILKLYLEIKNCSNSIKYSNKTLNKLKSMIPVFEVLFLSVFKDTILLFWHMVKQEAAKLIRWEQLQVEKYQEINEEYFLESSKIFFKRSKETLTDSNMLFVPHFYKFIMSILLTY